MGLLVVFNCTTYMPRNSRYDGVYYNPLPRTYVQIGHGWVSGASLRAKWQAANAEILYEALKHSTAGAPPAKRSRSDPPPVRTLAVRASWAFVQNLPAVTG